MFGIACKHYTKTFETVEELIQDIIESGQDPTYEITRDGKGTTEILTDLIIE